MIKKINRSVFLKQYPDFPQSDYYLEKFIFPDVFDSYILFLKSKSVKGHAKSLSNEFVKLIGFLGFTKIAFLGDSKTPWLFQDNDYKPVKESVSYLKDNGVGEKFNGSLELEIDQLSEFVRHAFWLTRCNASLPDFYFTDLGMNIIGTICKYGNLHVYALNESIDSKLEIVLKQTQFEILEDGNCNDQFYKGNKINHRQIVI